MLDYGEEKIQKFRKILDKFNERGQKIIDQFGLKYINNDEYVIDTNFYTKQDESLYNVTLDTDIDGFEYTSIYNNSTYTLLFVVETMYEEDVEIEIYDQSQRVVYDGTINSSSFYLILNLRDTQNIHQKCYVKQCYIMDIKPQLNMRIRDYNQAVEIAETEYEYFDKEFVYQRFDEQNGLVGKGYAEFFDFIDGNDQSLNTITEDGQITSLAQDYKYNDLYTLCFTGKEDGDSEYFNLTKSFLKYNSQENRFDRLSYKLVDSTIQYSINNDGYQRMFPFQIRDYINSSGETYEWYINEQLEFRDVDLKFKKGSQPFVDITDKLQKKQLYTLSKTDLYNQLQTNEENAAYYILQQYEDDVSVYNYNSYSQIPNIITFEQIKPVKVYAITTHNQTMLDVGAEDTFVINNPVKHVIIIGNRKSISVKFNEEQPEVISKDTSYTIYSVDEIKPQTISLKQIEAGQQYMILALEYKEQVSFGVQMEYGYGYKVYSNNDEYEVYFEPDINVLKDKVSSVQCVVKQNEGSLDLSDKFGVIKKPVDRHENGVMKYDLYRYIQNLMYLKLTLKDDIRVFNTIKIN